MTGKQRVWVLFSVVQASIGVLLLMIGGKDQTGFPPPIVSQISFGVNAPAALISALIRRLLIAAPALDGGPLLEASLYLLACLALWLWATAWGAVVFGRHRWSRASLGISAVISVVTGGTLLAALIYDHGHAPVAWTLAAVWIVFLEGAAIVVLVRMFQRET